MGVSVAGRSLPDGQVDSRKARLLLEFLVGDVFAVGGVAILLER